MIKEFVEKWNKNNRYLKSYFKTHKQKEYNSYLAIVKLVIGIILNDNEKYEEKFNVASMNHYSTDDVVEIDNGDYQGSMIYVTHKEGYQPVPKDYIYTYVWYGSCSGCDTLLAISDYEDGLPTDKQVKDYMILAMHILQRFKRIIEDE